MVDIHCHILPDLDDGAPEERVAIEMARMAAADGVTHVVATPHANYRFAFDPALNRHKQEALQHAIGDSLHILLGCDFHLSYENLEEIRQQPSRFTLNGHQYLLVEFADSGFPPGIDQIFVDLLAQKLLPVITHPERNPLFARRPEMILKWVEAGCYVQVTAASLQGRFGKKAMQAAHLLLQHKLIHFIASDAHNTSSRPPLLSEARRRVAAEQGEEAACALFEANPLAAIEGRALPWQPEPVPLPRRRWFHFRR